jgi:DNA-binding XRE family transcriptional regulator
MEKHEKSERQEQFIELRGFHEYSLDKCSKMLSVSKPTLIKWEKETTDKIINLKKAKFNQLVDSLELSACGRLERLRELNNKLKAEIDERGVGQLPDDKLIKLYMDSLDKINQLINDQGLRESISAINFDLKW